MRTLYWTVLACVSIVSSTALAADSFDLQKLAWLEGSWTGMKDGTQMEEHWTSVSGGAMLGMHRDVKGDRMTSFEFIRIQTSAEGTFYFASPRSAPPTPFKLVAVRDQHATFENKAHDFPQRIEYWLDANGLLHARIEGPMNGKTVSEEWAWTRVR